MGKKIVVKVLDIAKYVAFLLATLGVFIFQFVSEPIVIIISLSVYVEAFAIMFATSVIHSVEVFAADNLVKASKESSQNKLADNVVIAGNGELKGQKVEVVNLKSEKIWSVIGSVFYALFTIFTLVVLILY